MYRLCYLFIRNDLETTEKAGHSNPTHLQYPPSLSRYETCRHTERNMPRTLLMKCPLARCVHEEKVRETEFLDDPGPWKERWRTRRARPASVWAPAHAAALRSPTRTRSDLQVHLHHHQQLSLSWMDCMGVDWSPCASKQGQIVRIALREQGAGEARRRCEISSW